MMLFTVLFSLVLVICLTDARHYYCENNVKIDNFCLITSVNENSESTCRMNFPNHTTIKIQFPQIDNLSARIAYSMRNVVNLDISNGYVRTIYVKPELEFLRVTGCRLNQLYIDAKVPNQLVELHLSQNELSELPEHINHLENLTMLDLSNNYIEFIDMNQLHNLKFLSIVDISYNRIKVVFAADTVTLPDLVFLNLKHNSITGLHISNWETPILNELDLSYNKLSYVVKFPRKFPRMVSANFEENPLTCSWMRDTATQLEANNGTFSASLASCVEPHRLYESSETYNLELKMKDLLRTTISEIASNMTEVSVDIDDKIDDIFCRIVNAGK
ncbi:uncharacterized protein LOC128737707 [Sabethes cyaneus]|uniref:uncharacterized protein LOC128737707 n=1 Tax=Sabethes cyaneus TaxID=53552 RepID=UPI00237E0E6F|nr:uncharacterized protein LOC128737707 [Sabethes cyaneus]